ncbi:hypothetical protein P3S67_017663 [Capsicum chacoense]
MTILSKTWRQAWLTLPNIKFRVKNYYEDEDEDKGEGEKIVDTIMQRYRDSKIPIDKFELTNCLRDSSSEFLDRMENPYHSISSYHFPIIKVLAEKHLRELVLNNCSIDTSLSGGAANYHSLRKLSLSNVCLSENMLQDLLNSCPLIVSLILKSVLGLDKIEAPTREHLSFSNYSYLDLDVVECQNLKSLELNKVETPHGFLNLISKSQSLEVLKIQNCSDINDINTSNLEVLKIQNCSGIKDIDTSNVKVLKLQNYSDIKDIDTSKLKVLKIVNCSVIRDIDSSNLVSLEYIGDQIPQLKRTSESSQLNHSKITLHNNNNIDVVWFSS